MALSRLCSPPMMHAPSIGNFRSMATYIERKQAERAVAALFEGAPQFSLVTGAPSTGKSTLLTRFFEDKKVAKVSFAAGPSPSVRMADQLLKEALPKGPTHVWIDNIHQAQSDPRELFHHKLVAEFFSELTALLGVERQIHVVLSTSDSTLPKWIKSFVQSRRLQQVECTHATTKEARSFWDKTITTLCDRGQTFDLPDFQTVAKVCGTSLELIRQFSAELINSRGTLQDDDFSAVQNANRTVRSALMNASFLGKSVDNLLGIFQAIAQDPEGEVKHIELIDSFGEDAVSFLLEHGIITLSTHEPFHIDVKREEPLVRASTPAIRYVLSHLPIERYKKLNPRHSLMVP